MTREGTLEGGWPSSPGAGASSSCTLRCCCGTSTGGSAQGQSSPSGLWMVISQLSLGNSILSATVRGHFSSTSSGRSSAAHGHPVSPPIAPEREHREKHHPKHLLNKAKASEKKDSQVRKPNAFSARHPSHLTLVEVHGVPTPTLPVPTPATSLRMQPLQVGPSSSNKATVHFLAELMACTTLGTKRRAGRQAARERIKTLFPLPERDL